VNGYLYGTNSGGLMCVEVPSGDAKWQARSVGVGSLCYADGRLYVHAENPPGEVALVEATPEAYKELGRFTPPNGPTSRVVETNGTGKKVGAGKTWAYPTIANGRLYIRDWNCLWCYDVKAR
jgi:outer membrane protein assembly factor BamB